MLQYCSTSRVSNSAPLTSSHGEVPGSYDDETGSVQGQTQTEVLIGTASAKCAPENWIVRRPVRFFRQPNGSGIARYPPRNLLNAKYKTGPRHTGVWKPNATYQEPPFPLQPETSAYTAALKLAEQEKDIAKPVHVLDLLAAVYSLMDDDRYDIDHWGQQRVTIPSQQAINGYRNAVALYKERMRGQPAAPKTLKQVFRADPDTKARAESQRQRPGCQAGDTVAKITARLFDVAELTPGALDRFRYLVEKDLERYARELKVFRETTLKQFDEENNLLPVVETAQAD